MKKLKLEELERASLSEYKDQVKLDVIVVLDDIRSGMNVGSMFRSCDCFGLSKIMLCGITPKPPHKEIFKTAIGAQNSVDWQYHEDILILLKNLRLKGYQIIGVEQTNESIPLKDLTFEADAKVAIVMGNEVNGLNDKVLEILDKAVELEQFGTKHSLNVSVCAGIVFWQLGQLLR